jgi:hypothetical protein
LALAVHREKNNWQHRVFNGQIESCFLYHQDWPPKEMQENPERHGVPVRHVTEPMLNQLFGEIKSPIYPPPPPLSAHKTSLDLVGVTLFYETAVQTMSDEESERNRGVAQHQWSFVFNNTPSLPVSRAHELVTIEFIEDLTWARYDLYRPAFESPATDSQADTRAILRPGSWDRRSIDGAVVALGLALALKRHCIPALEAGDDYEMSKSLLSKDAPIRDEYLLESADPALRSFWGV